MDPGIVRLSRMIVKLCGIKLWFHVKLATWTFQLWQASFKISMHKDVPAISGANSPLIYCVCFEERPQAAARMPTCLHLEKPRWSQLVLAGLHLPHKVKRWIHRRVYWCLIPLFLSLSPTHTPLRITNSGNSRPPKMWQGHIRRWEVDRQGWQSKNHAPRFNGWPDEDALLPTLRPPSLPDLPLPPCCCEQAWPTKPRVTLRITQQHRWNNHSRDRGTTCWEKRGKEQK